MPSAADVLLNYSPGDEASVTFTRVSSGTAIDASGKVYVVGNNVLRIQHEDLDGDGVREKPGVLIEDSRIQRALSNNTFTSGWFTVGTITVTSGYVNVGAFDLSKISDASVVSGSYTGFNYGGHANRPWAAGDGIEPKPLSFFWTKADAESSLGGAVNLTDSTEGGFMRFSTTIKSTADGYPIVTVSSGTFIGWEELFLANARRVFRLHYQTGVVNPANEHVIRIFPTNASLADTGDIIVGGFQIENQGAHCTSLIWPLTTSVDSSFTRDIDTLTLPIDPLVKDMTVLVESSKRVFSGITNITTSPGLFSISTVVPGISIVTNQASNLSYGVQIRNENIQSASTNVLPGKKQTVVAQYNDLAADPKARLDAGAGYSVDAAPSNTGFQRWGSNPPFVHVGQRIGNTHRFNGVITKLLIAQGLFSWQEMQYLADRPYISWTDALGRANLTLTLPRFSNWNPDLVEIMDTASVVGTGVRYKTLYRTDYLATMSANNMKAADLGLVMRLKQHLTNGGTAYVMTNDKQDTAYEVTLSPEGDVTINFTDAQSQEYSVSLDLRNSANEPMVVYY